ncbi:fad-dependent isoamyl alcohol oxidase [Trichoderma cornu-damae]|uniref:Fad-dependent isoamyl alcohol oxidase n=1 Tax=Trichoderma cornu-damae TaxID=654480 RepID=A0A9P8QJZ9_9HYPO|nr:fad-dependent isoamyl alcohol oxidase [Trichoderma cornu-damae]
MSLHKAALLGLAGVGNAALIIPRDILSSTAQTANCRVLPGDAAWPKASDWAQLNKTLNGHLITAVPMASVCHDAPYKNFNNDLCSQIQATWNETKLTHISQPAEFLSMYFENYTCDPFTARSKPCELGNYASYIINVTSAADVQAGIAFAKKKNVRLVIKNTGHDYLGKSTGKGGLTLWTHNLKSTKFIPNYNAPYYKGPAIKLGAGIEGFEAYAAANVTGHRIVGGSCPTVGIAGGYSQGGGHSTLASSYGLGADNVLEWEVVTPNGSHVVATPTQNSDLYWAITGGGAGTFGVVLSMTSRLHQDSIVGGASLIFDDSKIGNAAFWEAVGAFHALLPDFVDTGNSATYTLTSTEFLSWGITLPGADIDQVNVLMKPFLDDLTSRGIDYQYQPHVAPNFFDHYSYYFGPLPEGYSDYAPFTGSRILPRDLFLDSQNNAIVMDALRNASLSDGYSPLVCQALNVSSQYHPDNAVHPAWRTALSICLTPGNWDPTATPDKMAARQDYAANVLQPMLDAATPGGGVYLNEANYKQQNWQEAFHGSNYARLLQIKKKYDPESLLYANTAVGSEAWYLDSNNRLCRSQ